MQKIQYKGLQGTITCAKLKPLHVHGAGALGPHSCSKYLWRRNEGSPQPVFQL